MPHWTLGYIVHAGVSSFPTDQPSRMINSGMLARVKRFLNYDFPVMSDCALYEGIMHGALQCCRGLNGYCFRAGCCLENFEALEPKAEFLPSGPWASRPGRSKMGTFTQ